MVLSRWLSVAAEKSVLRSPQPSGNFETEFCEEVPGSVGFTLLETLQHYVPHVIQNITPKAVPDAGQLVGL